MTSNMKIVLESDGTEVDEEEYFSTLEQNTCFMILKENEDWIPPSEYNYLLVCISCLNEKVVLVYSDVFQLIN